MVSRLKSLLVGLFVLFALALSGCEQESVFDGIDRYAQPIPDKVVAEMRAKGLTPADPIMIRILKQESELEIWKRDNTGRYALLKTFPMCRWSGKLGPKTTAGDRQAPEGYYMVNAAMMNPKSQYYLSFNLGYPNKLERALGYTGESLMVHGACSSSGCYALTDAGMAEIYPIMREAFAGGQTSIQVQALPFRMTPENMARVAADPNFAFWKNLKEGYDIFEVTHQVPQVDVCGKRYVFDSISETGAPLQAAAPCPTLTAKIDPAVIAKRQKDEVRISAYETGKALEPIAYVDGGMHPVFRSILKQRRGAEKLAEKTSLTKVPISRPQAALAAPIVDD